MTVKESMPLKKGISTVEVLIGLALILAAGSIVAPSFFRQMVRYERTKTIAQLDAIVAQAWLNALQSGIMHRIKFNLSSGVIVVEKQTYNETGEIIYQKVPLSFSDKDFVLPRHYEIVNFYIDGIDECAQHGAGRTMEDVWFYIYPRGHTQAVVINMVDTKDTGSSSAGYEVGLVLNPFKIEFEVYDAFQKP